MVYCKFHLYHSASTVFINVQIYCFSFSSKWARSEALSEVPNYSLCSFSPPAYSRVPERGNIECYSSPDRSCTADTLHKLRMGIK